MYHFYFFCLKNKKVEQNKLDALSQKKQIESAEYASGLGSQSMWSYSVMVITQDSESCDPGSSPGRTLFFSFFDQIMSITDRGSGIAWIGVTRCCFVCLNAREV